MTKENCVRVHWTDSCTHEGWQKIVDPIPSIVVTIGILVCEDAHCITVAASRCSEGHYSGAICIPKCSVTEMKKFQN